MTHKEPVSQQEISCPGDKIRLKMSAKDTRLTFRVASDLKRKLESVAASEGRSVAQICEAFLHAGLASYHKEGTKYVQRFLSRHETEP
jgi:hypothetical protein